MVLQSATIIFNDSSSRLNRDLVDYLKRNLQAVIRKGSLVFQYKIVKPSDFDGLRRMGVKTLPAMIINNRPYIGVPNIIAEIRRRSKNNPITVQEKTDDETVRDFQMASLGDVKKDADGKFVLPAEQETDESKSLMDAFQREVQRRGAAAGHVNPDYGETMNHATRTPRNTEQDLDDHPQDNRRNTAYNTNPAPMYRPDNIDNPQMADALASLNAIGRNATDQDRQDDTMMAALLARMGGGD